MVDFQGYFIAAVLIGVFSFALLSFGSQMAINNPSNNTILDNQIINETFANLSTELTDVNATISAQRESFYSKVPIIGQIGLILDTVWGSAKASVNIVTGMFSLLFTLIGTALGIPPVVIGVFVAITIVMGIILTWRFIRSGA